MSKISWNKSGTYIVRNPGEDPCWFLRSTDSTDYLVRDTKTLLNLVLVKFIYSIGVRIFLKYGRYTLDDLRTDERRHIRFHKSGLLASSAEDEKFWKMVLLLRNNIPGNLSSFLSWGFNQGSKPGVYASSNHLSLPSCLHGCCSSHLNSPHATTRGIPAHGKWTMLSNSSLLNQGTQTHPSTISLNVSYFQYPLQPFFFYQPLQPCNLLQKV